MAPSAPKWLRLGQSASAASPPPPEGAAEAFRAFADADSFQECLTAHSRLMKLLGMETGVPFAEFYPRSAAMRLNLTGQI